MSRRLKLKDMQELSEYIYKKNRDDLYSYLSINEIETYTIYDILINDRCIILLSGDTLYISISGSDDLQDWKENMFVRYLKTIKRYHYAKAGACLPAAEILRCVKQFCEENCVDYKTVKIRELSHSRGADIGESLCDQIETGRGKDNLMTYGNGSTGAGFWRFGKLAKTKNRINFLIKGDFAKWINPFNRHSGKVIKLPKQIKGFWNRFGNLFKGKMNHREYRVLRTMQPYCDWE